MPEQADQSLHLRSIARAALLETTDASTVGPFSGLVEEENGAVSLTFEAAMTGYPGWHWTISMAVLDGEEPSVLEVELMPGEGALLAPDWVPWSDRLAEYEASQEGAEAAAAEGESDDEDDADEDDSEGEDGDESDDEDDESDDDDDDDEDDDEEDGDVIAVVHGGDVDGVDIDDLDVSAAASAEDDASAEDGDDDVDPDEEFEKTY